MPSADVCDLRDVVDAINQLCDTMKTSGYDEEGPAGSRRGSLERALLVAHEGVLPEEIVAEIEPDPDWYVASHVEPAGPDEIVFRKVEHYNTETWRQSVSRLEMASPEDVIASKVESHFAERWSDSSVSLPGVAEDAETDERPAPEGSEMYYTASSEVSLLSDLEPAEKCPEEAPAEKAEDGDRKEGVVAGHVAAMRERFESMTRANTPCPELPRGEPAPDTPSPDLG